MISNATSTLLGGFILGSRMHGASLMVWITVRQLETHDAHSGYEFPWSPFRLLPFSADATYHDYHHSRNVGNYSSTMTIWDTIFNTNQDYYINKKEQSNLKQD